MLRASGAQHRYARFLREFRLGHAGREFHQAQAFGGDVEDRELGDDAVDHADAGQREGAFRKQLVVGRPQ